MLLINSCRPANFFKVRKSQISQFLQSTPQPQLYQNSPKRCLFKRFNVKIKLKPVPICNIWSCICELAEVYSKVRKSADRKSAKCHIYGRCEVFKSENLRICDLWNLFAERPSCLINTVPLLASTIVETIYLKITRSLLF
jgi:hypothetical protein